MQPGLSFDISYKNLINKLEKKYLLPHEFPYDNIKCEIFPPMHKARRFRAVFDCVGYSIKCTNNDTNINIHYGPMFLLYDKFIYTDIKYRNKDITYVSFTEKNRFFVILKVTDNNIDKLFYELEYSTSLSYDVEKMKSDIKIIVDSSY